MRSSSARLAAVVVAAATAICLTALPGAALAGDEPVRNVSGTVEGTAAGVPSGPEGAAPAAPAEAQAVGEAAQQEAGPTDTPGHETDEPTQPQHASGTIAETKVAGEDLVTIGHTNAETDDEGSRGDVVVLAIGGNEVIGFHSDSQEGPASDGADALEPLCEETGGGVCLELLFAETNSTSDHADARVGVANACVGGSGDVEDIEDNCNGAVGAEVATSSSEVDSNDAADQETQLAGACIGPGGRDAETGTCSGIGASVIHAESHSSADGPTTSGDSHLLRVDVGGEEAVDIDDSTTIAIPPDCPTDPGSLVCLFLNQGQAAFAAGEFAGYNVEAVHLEVLVSDAIPGGALLLGHLGTAGTFISVGAPAGPGPGPGPRVPPGGPALPVTGFALAVPLGILGLLSIGGAGLLAWSRRREASA